MLILCPVALPNSFSSSDSFLVASSGFSVYGIMSCANSDSSVSYLTVWIPFIYFACLIAMAAAAKSLQSCPTLCDPVDCSLPGFSVHGILQARTLEWVAISFSNA